MICPIERVRALSDFSNVTKVPDERMVLYAREIQERQRREAESDFYREARAWSELGHRVVGAEYPIKRSFWSRIRSYVLK